MVARTIKLRARRSHLLMRSNSVWISSGECNCSATVKAAMFALCPDGAVKGLDKAALGFELPVAGWVV